MHHGLWDYDNPAAPNLLDITVNGARVKALAQITKQGYVYTFDRVTGKPIWPIDEKPVPASDVPGEKASPTQPIPSKPAPFEYQGVTVNDLADFTPEIRAMAEKAIQGFRTGPLFTPPSVEGTLVRPGTTGGANWSGAAVDPATGMLYVPSRNAYAVSKLSPPDQGARQQPALHADARPQSADAGRPAAVQAAVLAHDGDRHEHRQSCVDDSDRRRRSHPQQSAAQGA